MSNYIINVNDFTVRQDQILYNLIAELYPQIKELYYKLWFLNNIASLSEKVKNARIEQIETEIEEKRKLYNIPENLLFIKDTNGYVEPVSNTLFTFAKPYKLGEVSDKYKNNYLKNNKDNYFLENQIPKFKKLTMNRGRK